MPATKPKAHELFALVVEHAHALREAGVTRLVLDGCTVEIAQKQTETITDREIYVDSRDPLDDPATYGGRGVPQYRRRDE